jgi:hypothetical protein
MPVPIVMRSRLRSTTDEPPSEEETPPPNMSERPPPLPLCSSTRVIMSRLVMTSTTFRMFVSTQFLAGGECGATPVGGDECMGSSLRRVGAGEPHDAHEVLDVQARAADEAAVDVALGHDAADVAALHRAAVEHAHAVGQVAE